ncbi:SigE family RNA polymerase sigma factor [Quadrisphaera sp. DSM 44207]|uniref:SigE family RNA polymerase sigma factor n=1 Tax=Quadrisphaera sp. DSM 44207 TaxID=1881057 RepID=UPI00088B4E51|nr:SigE family RNA polymerase sigma factor [Quadrisphaera sp. DSM 44207]SDQ86890.1 RNA polymerase sigma-70 factor, sigma-E family [Quadrisphaera sp. DSM 44207]
MSWLRAPRVETAPGFEELVAARSGPMLAMARGLVRREQDAEDLVQDVLATALLKWDRVSAADDPAAYVNRMLVNAATSWWRRGARREQPTEAEAMPEAAVGDPNAASGDRDALLAALRRLPARHRAVLVLRYYEGLPDAEIAQLLDVALPTVRSCAHRGLLALRRAGALEGEAPAGSLPV